MARTRPCDRVDAASRLRQAEAFAMVARLVIDDDSDVAAPGVAAALAVLAGIAASDAACCAKLKLRARGKDHREALPLLGSVEPHGKQMATDLDRILKRKDDAHYGLALLPRPAALKLVEYAERMARYGRKVLEA